MSGKFLSDLINVIKLKKKMQYDQFGK